MLLPPQGVMVIWEWEMNKESELDPDIDHVLETSSEGLAPLTQRLKVVIQMLVLPQVQPQCILSHSSALEQLMTYMHKRDTAKSQYTAWQGRSPSKCLG